MVYPMGSLDKEQKGNSTAREKLPLISLYRLSKLRSNAKYRKSSSKSRPPEYALRSNKEWVREQILRMTTESEELMSKEMGTGDYSIQQVHSRDNSTHGHIHTKTINGSTPHHKSVDMVSASLS